MTDSNNDRELHLVDWLRKIQLAWELDLEQLSRIAHVPRDRLEAVLRISADELATMPSVPVGLEPSVALVGLYRQLLTVYPTSEAQNFWLKEPNHVFEGHRPIEVITQSPEHLAYAAYAVETGLRLGPKTSHSE